MKKNKTATNWPILIFRIISVFLIIICIIYIIEWYNENKKNKEMLDSTFLETNIPKDSNVDDNFFKNKIEFNYKNLLAKNSDTIGWIKINNTSINHPILKGKDNKYYLNHSFDKSINSSGWVFADYRCASDFSSKNTVIYGHSRTNGSMFGNLKNMLKPNWYNSNSHIFVSTPEQNKIYEIFSMYTIKAETYYTTINFDSDDNYKSFLNTILKRSIYDFNLDLSIDDKIITLSTCSSFGNNRVVVHAKLVK